MKMSYDTVLLSHLNFQLCFNTNLFQLCFNANVLPPQTCVLCHLKCTNTWSALGRTKTRQMGICDVLRRVRVLMIHTVPKV